METLAEAERLVDRLQGLVTRFTIGSQLFTAAGPAAVESVHKGGAEVFLDLKFHDIPSTVAGAARRSARCRSHPYRQACWSRASSVRVVAPVSPQ